MLERSAPDSSPKTTSKHSALPKTWPSPKPSLISAATREQGSKRSPAPTPDAYGFSIIEPVCAVFRRALKGEGLKYTPERANVLNVVLRFEGLFEAEQVLDRVKGDGFRVSKATVYRTLKLLAEAGIVQRVLLDSEQSHYQLVYGQGAPKHILVRVDSNSVTEIEVPGLEEVVHAVCAARGLELAGFRLHMYATDAASMK